MELGTALESILTEALQISTSNDLTLGPLVERAQNAGLPIPGDVVPRFVEPRNDAVHRAIVPHVDTVDYGLNVLDGLVRWYHPDWSCDEQLAFANRPTRQSLVMVAPPNQANS
jgi:hypothetical protein